ncbi:MAG: glycosyltransferase [Candidatus Latescibacteria bacterium]|nr:glycosyltransferase [Candidatus Latescibacterota bacterium]
MLTTKEHRSLDTVLSPPRQAPIKVLFLTGCVRGGGASWSLFYLLKYLDRSRVEPIVVLPTAGLLARRLETIQVRYRFCPDLPERLDMLRFAGGGWLRTLLSMLLNVVGGLRTVVALIRFIRAEHVDVIYCNHMLVKPIGALAGQWTGTPVILHCRTVYRSFLRRRLLAHIARLTAVKQVICISKATEQAYHFSGKTVIIPNGVDLSEYQPEKVTGTLRTELGLDEEPLIVGYVGRIIRMKGLDVLLDAARTVLHANPRVVICIIGENLPSTTDDLQALYAQQAVEYGIADRVRFLGFREDVRPCLRDLDLLVVPSKEPEAFGRVTIEAMAMGVPVIATAHGGSCEIIDDRVDGFLVPPNDARALARTILAALASPDTRRTMGERARRKVGRCFDAADVARQIEERLCAISRKPPSGRIVYILKHFPAISETFILREITALRRRGLPVTVVALCRAHREGLSSEEEACLRETRFVPPLFLPSVLLTNMLTFLASPRSYLDAFVRVMGLPHRRPYFYLRAWYHFLAVGYIARALRDGQPVVHLHAHFASTSTEIAMGVATLLGVPFSFTAHAKDIYVDANALREKIQAARFVVTCSDYNARYLRALCPELHPEHVTVVRCGIPIDTVVRRKPHVSSPPMILSVGRLVEKKAHRYLIEACGMMKNEGLAFECVIIGDGPLRGRLSEMILRQRLQGCVTLLGSLPYRQVEEFYRRAAVVVLPSLITAEGDREGMPSVLTEAMMFGVPVISSPTAGIPELVVDGETGLLVPPADAQALARAIVRVLHDAPLRSRLVARGRAKVEADYDLEQNVARLIARFDERSIGNHNGSSW